MAAITDQPSNKTFKLHEDDSKFIQLLQAQTQQLISLYVTGLLTHTFKYPLTENTQFRIKDGTIEIFEGKNEEQQADPKAA
jgi:hypothetical protein